MFDRFTRDEVSSWVWWPATMILVVLVVLTFPGEHQAIEGRRDDAARRAWALTTGILAPTLEGTTGPIQGDAATQIEDLVRQRVLAAPWTDVVRIWSAGSTLLWSSDPDDTVGSAGGLNDDDITRAIADPMRASWVVNERDLEGQPIDATFSAYAPFTLGGEAAAAQFEAREATLVGDVQSDWLGYRIVLGFFALVTLALAIGSMREPLARIGAGVPFFRTSVPSDLEVIDVDRKLELERAGTNARERVTNVNARLHESEELRLKAEGDLQRALSQLATQSARPTRSVIPRASDTAADDTSTPPIAPVAEPTPAPGSEGLTLVPSLDERPGEPSAPEPAEPAAAAEPAVTAKPVKRRSSERAHPSRRRPAAATTWEPTARRAGSPEDAEAVVMVPDVPTAGMRDVPDVPTAGVPDVPAAPEVATPVAPSAPEVATPAAPSAPGTTRPDVVLPASEVVEPEEEARQVLERLVEPVGASVVPVDDPSVLRAKLARTAALKKPGSRHEERLTRDDGPTS